MSWLRISFTLVTLLIMVLTIPVASQEELTPDQILERAYQTEVAGEEQIKDYVCQATFMMREPQKDGTAKTLAIVEKTIYRKRPDKRMEKYNAVTEEGKVLSPMEVAEYQKKEKSSMTMRSRSFLDPEERGNYSFELLPPDTIRTK